MISRRCREQTHVNSPTSSSHVLAVFSLSSPSASVNYLVIYTWNFRLGGDPQDPMTAQINGRVVLRTREAGAVLKDLSGTDENS